MTKTRIPRVVVAGLAGDSGKTLVSLALILGLNQRGLAVAPFKKGPDYIDAAWLSKAAGRPGRHLDTFLMDASVIRRSVARAAAFADIAVIEGNRGLFDGMTAQGDHATAALAKLIAAPVILVVDCTKMTRTAAALVKGCQVMDPALPIGAVVLNRVATARQEKLIREAIAAETGIPVLGAIPRRETPILPSRHLGLVTAAEHPDAARALDEVARIAEAHLDIEAMIDLARRAVPLETADQETPLTATRAQGPSAARRIGVFRDQAFSFYYPENLEALEAQGAGLTYVSPMCDDELPAIDALYIGGGFPELHAQALSENRRFRDSVARRVDEGLLVFAECGGLMYLGRTLSYDKVVYPMVGAMPFDVVQADRPEGHGYVQARVDFENPFFEMGFGFRGHEFHYSRIRQDVGEMPTAFALERGEGVGRGRDGLCAKRIVASYTHLHALGTPEWAPAFIEAI